MPPDLSLYSFKEKIGNGSFGEVWLVKNQTSGKKCVLKKLNLSSLSQVEQKRAILESQLLATLRHPNIVTYLDSFFQSCEQKTQINGEMLNIVMCFCEGGDLYRYIRKQNGRSIDESQIVDWLIQLCMALKYLNDKRILHRDLKTRNIFLTRKGLIKLGDFGIARVLDGTQEMAATLIGTPYYMSPEILTGELYNHKSDIWSLGCCVYEMASLKHAFRAQNFNSLLYKVLQCKPPEIPCHYSQELSTLTSAMLNSDPDKRPSAQAILEHQYIHKHIYRFLEATKNRTPNNCIQKYQNSATDPSINDKNESVCFESAYKLEKSVEKNSKICPTEFRNEEVRNEEKNDVTNYLCKKQISVSSHDIRQDAVQSDVVSQVIMKQIPTEPTNVEQTAQPLVEEGNINVCCEHVCHTADCENTSQEVIRYPPSEARARRRQQLQKCSSSVDSLDISSDKNQNEENPTNFEHQRPNISARQRRRERLNVEVTDKSEQGNAKSRPKSAPSRLKT